MQKTILLFVLFAFSLSFQQARAQGDSNFGLGVGINTSSLFGALTEAAFVSSTGIYIPIASSASLRFEPNFAFARAETESGVAEETGSAFQIGAGLFSTRTVQSSTQVYFGVRLGAAFTKFKDSFGPDEDSISKTDFYIGPAAGGEYFFGDNFSLGAEAQLVVVIFGEFDEESDVSSNLIFSNSIFFARVYF